MTAIRADINPQILSWARRSSGVTVEQLARTLGIPRTEIMAWEFGETRPTFSQLISVATRLKRPVAAFYLSSPPNEAGSPPDFRSVTPSKLGSFSTETLFAIREARNIQDITQDLTNELEETWAPKLPSLTISHSPEEQALHYREALKQSVQGQIDQPNAYRALSHWRRIVEQQGILALQFPIPPKDARGFSLNGAGIPVVVASSKDSPQARSFTLLHELAHLGLKQPGVCSIDVSQESSTGTVHQSIEVFCNAFAAEFLLPGTDPSIRADLEQLAHDRELPEAGINTISLKYKVSWQLVLRKLLSTGLISKTQYQKKRAYWSKFNKERKSSGGPPPALRPILQKGPAFVALVLKANARGLIPESSVADFLSINLRHLDEMRDRLEAQYSA